MNNREDDNKQYAVKAFSKEFLMAQDKGKVFFERGKNFVYWGIGLFDK